MNNDPSTQSIIERLQQQILSQLSSTQTSAAAAQPPRRPTRSRFYHPPPLHTNLESDLEEVRQQNRNYYIRELLAIAREYQREQREYHQSMNTILSLLTRILPSTDASASSPRTETQETSSSIPHPSPLRRHSYLDRLGHMGRRRSRIPTATATTDETASALDNIFISYFFSSPQTREDAAAPLTERQIQQNTRIIFYDTSMNETRCPITMEDFVEGEEVLQIAGCGHYFKREGLMEWFRRNHLCPVCRHRLLRSGGTRFTTTTVADPPSEPIPTLEELSENVAHNGIVEEPEDSEDDHATVRAEDNNRINSPTSATYRMFEDRYTFELPLLYDTSNNVFYSENNEPIENNRDLQQTIQRELLNAFQLFRSPRTQP
jgi:hypothetical protein